VGGNIFMRNQTSGSIETEAAIPFSEDDIIEGFGRHIPGDKSLNVPRDTGTEPEGS
jgi:hypothetical protein